MDKKRLTGVTYTYPLRFGVDNDIHSHRQICGGIDKDMAVACTGFNDRDRAVFHNGADQTGTSSRDQNIHILVQFHECSGSLSGGIFDEKQSIRVHVCFRQCAADAGYDRLDRMKRITSTL